MIYTRNIVWGDGHRFTQGNLERPALLSDEKGEPTHIFFASGPSSTPFSYDRPTYVLSFPLLSKANEGE